MIVELYHSVLGNSVSFTASDYSLLTHIEKDIRHIEKGIKREQFSKI